MLNQIWSSTIQIFDLILHKMCLYLILFSWTMGVVSVADIERTFQGVCSRHWEHWSRSCSFSLRNLWYSDCCWALWCTNHCSVEGQPEWSLDWPPWIDRHPDTDVASFMGIMEIQPRLQRNPGENPSKFTICHLNLFLLILALSGRVYYHEDYKYFLFFLPQIYLYNCLTLLVSIPSFHFTLSSLLHLTLLFSCWLCT